MQQYGETEKGHSMQQHGDTEKGHSMQQHGGTEKGHSMQQHGETEKRMSSEGSRGRKQGKETEEKLLLIKLKSIELEGMDLPPLCKIRCEASMTICNTMWPHQLHQPEGVLLQCHLKASPEKEWHTALSWRGFPAIKDYQLIHNERNFQVTESKL